MKRQPVTVAFVMHPSMRDFGHNIFGLCECAHHLPLPPSVLCLECGIARFCDFTSDVPLKRTQSGPKGAPRKSAYIFAIYYHFRI